jgi:hypothetical protein
LLENVAVSGCKFLIFILFFNDSYIGTDRALCG